MWCEFALMWVELPRLSLGRTFISRRSHFLPTTANLINCAHKNTYRKCAKTRRRYPYQGMVFTFSPFLKRCLVIFGVELHTNVVSRNAIHEYRKHTMEWQPHSWVFCYARIYCIRLLFTLFCVVFVRWFSISFPNISSFVSIVAAGLIIKNHAFLWLHKVPKQFLGGS